MWSSLTRAAKVEKADGADRKRDDGEKRDQGGRNADLKRLLLVVHDKVDTIHLTF